MQKSTTQKVFGDRCHGSHRERRDCVDRYVKYDPRPRQREPFGKTHHKRCARRPYVPVDKSSAATITQLTCAPCTFSTTICCAANNSPTIVHAHRIKIHLVRPLSDVICSNGCVDPSGTDYS